MHKLQSLFAIALLALATACAFTPTPSVVVAPVGPAPDRRLPAPAATDVGYLEVRTAMRAYVSEREMNRIHTAYGIYTPDGRRFKSVQNAQSLNSPEPQVIALPPGAYAIKAWADGLILVKVPIVIESQRLTRVNLEAGDAELAKQAKPEQLVRLPNGRIVGWSATATPPR